jgi:hypothetical protein
MMVISMMPKICIFYKSINDITNLRNHIILVFYCASKYLNMGFGGDKWRSYKNYI